MNLRSLMAAAIVCLTATLAFAQSPPAGSTKVMQGFTTVGPDIVVGELYNLSNYAAVGGVDAFSVGTRSCNIGSANCAWISSTNMHPVIAQQMYRLHDGKFEQIGMSWLKHGFTALDQNYCDSCMATGGSSLGIGCSDPYSASLNGSQSNLGPRFEVNATTGVFTYPPTNGSTTGNSIFKRLQVKSTDLDPANFPGARYFVEAMYVSQDDAAAGNNDNNASWKEVTFSAVGGGDYNIAFASGALTNNLEPGIFAWQAIDPSVQLKSFDVPGDGRFWVGFKATDNGNGTFDYEYAIYNMNSDRSAWKFEVPTSPTATVTNVQFHDVDYHSGEPYPTVDWPSSVTGGVVSWAAQDFATNPNTNALRWSSLYNFRFTSDTAPGNGTLHLFKPGTPATVLIDMGPPAFALSLPNGVPTEISTGVTTDVLVHTANIAGMPDASTAEVSFRINGGGWMTNMMSDQGNGDFIATLPAVNCMDIIDWYVSITAVGDTIPLTEPADAPVNFHSSSATLDEVTLSSDNAETNTGFTVSGTATDGQWGRGIPVDNNRGDPATDSDGSGQCWLTDNDPNTSNSDVDGGETILTSPVYNLFDLPEAVISFDLWYDNNNGVVDDTMQIEISNGGSWMLVEAISTTLNGWTRKNIRVADFVAPNLTVQFRLRVGDFGQGSIVEAGLDAVEVSSCPLLTEAFAAGTVGVGASLPAEQVLLINGSNGGPLRRVAIGFGDAMTFAVAQPSTNPFSSLFVIWGVVQTPPASFTYTLPGGVGTMLFPPCDADILNPALFLFTDNSGFSTCPGVLGSTGTPWSYTVPTGANFNIDITLQGVIIDPSAPFNFGITNAVNFRVDSGL